MGKKSTPPPPDYEGAAEQTAAGNLELLEAQTAANRPTQITPWGTSSWEQTGGTPATPGHWAGVGRNRRWVPGTPGTEDQWTQTITLSPEQQAALESQFRVGQARSGLAESLLGRVGEEFGDVMNWDQFGDYQRDLGTGDEARQSAIDEMYGQATSRLDPQWEQRRDAQMARLYNQGLRPGDEAFDTAMGNLDRSQTDAYNQAMFSAIRHGGAEGSRVFDMNRNSAAFGNQVRQAQIAEEMQRRGFSLNEINAILTGQQVAMPNMPGFAQAERTQGPDYLTAAQLGYQADLDAFNAENAWMNSMMGGAGSAAGMFMFSDKRLKRNVRLIGKYGKFNIYSWTYIWGEKSSGVMAHEMPPEYLAVHPSGYLMVNYGML